MFTDNSKVLIIYHKEDNDGLFSMAIAYNYLQYELKLPADNIDIKGADYDLLNHISNDIIDGEMTELDIIIEKYDFVIMTDISFNNFSYMKKLYKNLGNHFIWIDHHAPVIKQSVIEKVDGIQGLRDSSRSAILNMYRFFYDPFDNAYSNKDNKIELFRILSAWDSFSFEREGYSKSYVMHINTGINNTYMLDAHRIINLVYGIIYPNVENDNGGEYRERVNDDEFVYGIGDDFVVNDEYYHLINEMYYEGEKYNTIQDAKNHDVVKTYGEAWKLQNGRTAVVIFMSCATNSLWFSDVQKEYENGIVFKHLKNGSWSVSIYNTSDDDTFNCGAYMKEHYHGGGHIGAAGCQLSEEQFIEVLKKKIF